jgi:hypothetical protein
VCETGSGYTNAQIQCPAKEVSEMRDMHIVDHVWENGMLYVLGAFFVGIIAFALTMAGF